MGDVIEDIHKTEPSAPGAEAERFHTGRVLTIGIGHAVHDTYTAFLAPLLPVFIATLSLSKTEAGLLTVFIQGPSLLQPFVGHLADRVGPRYFFILPLVVTAMMMSLLGVAPAYWVLALFLVATGLSSACLHAVGPVMTGDLSGCNLGRGMGFWMVGGELGRTLGPLVIVTAVQFLTLQGTPWLMIGGFFLSVLLYLWLGDVSPRSSRESQGLPWRQALRGLRPLLFPLVGIIVVRAFMLSALTTYLPTFLSEEGADLWLAGAALTVFQAAGMVGALLGGALSDRMGRRKVLFVSLLTTSLLMFVFLGLQGWGRFPLLLLMGFTALSLAPVIMALVQESVPGGRALANGVYMALNFILRSGVVVVLGAVGDWLGLRSAFIVSASAPLLGLPLILLLPGGGRRPRRREGRSV